MRLVASAMIRILFLVALVLSLSTPADAAAIAHAYKTTTAWPGPAIESISVSNSTTYADVESLASDWSGATGSSGSGFVAGKKYLIWVSAQVRNGSTAQAWFRTVHGSTAFAESEIKEEAGNVLSTTYTYWTVWTAVSSEAITFQYRVGTTGTARADQVTIFAINLSDDLTENTDWFYDGTSSAATTDLDLTNTFQEGASVQFTPIAGSDWLVLTLAQYTHNTDDRYIKSEINAAGTITSAEPTTLVYGSPTEQSMQTLARVYPALGATTQTFKERSAVFAGTTERKRVESRVFALNLNKFAAHTNAYTSAQTDASATPFATNIQTASITPTVTGNVWHGGFFGFTKAAGTRLAQFRTRVDSVDVPATQTSDAYNYQMSATGGGGEPFIISAVSSMTAAAHTIDLDMSTDSAGGGTGGQHRTVWAVTMELPGGGAVSNQRQMLLGVGGP